MRMNGRLALATIVLLLVGYGIAVQGTDPLDGLSSPEPTEAAVEETPGQLPDVPPELPQVEPAEHRADALLFSSDDLVRASEFDQGKDTFDLEITVVDGLGKPQPGALIGFYMGGAALSGQSEPKPTRRRALAGGKITLYDVPAGGLWATAAGRQVHSPSREIPFEVAADGELQVRLAGGLAIHGRVHLAVPGPVGLRVSKLPQVNKQFQSGSETLIASSTSHLSSDPFHFGGLEAGDYKLRVWAQGYGKREIQIRLPQDSKALDIELLALVDVLFDVRYLSGRAPAAIDLQLMPLPPERSGGSERRGGATKAVLPAAARRGALMVGTGLPAGRFLFMSVLPGDYDLVVRPRTATDGSETSKGRGALARKYALTVPRETQALPLLEVWLEEPIDTAVRLTFRPLADTVISSTTYLSCTLVPETGEEVRTRSLLSSELQGVVPGGDLVLKLGPIFPGSYELAVRIQDPAKFTPSEKESSNAALLRGWGGMGGQVSGRVDQQAHGSPDSANATPWRAPWRATPLSFTLLRGEGQRELSVELHPN